MLSAGVMGGCELLIERAQKLDVMLQYEVKEMVESVSTASNELENDDGTSFYHVLTQSLSE